MNKSSDINALIEQMNIEKLVGTNNMVEVDEQSELTAGNNRMSAVGAKNKSKLRTSTN